MITGVPVLRCDRSHRLGIWMASTSRVRLILVFVSMGALIVSGWDYGVAVQSARKGEFVDLLPPPRRQVAVAGSSQLERVGVSWPEFSAHHSRRAAVAEW